MSKASHQLLTTLLRDVSRSFYLTLRVLPVSVRPQIGTAYLLARLTDTIADTGLVSIEKRLVALSAWQERILNSGHGRLDLGDLAESQGTPAERTLLSRSDEVLNLLLTFDERDRQLIRDVLRTITSGQKLDLERFGRASAEMIVALRTAEELDDYTYRVAGCVGEFWTFLCRRHVFPWASLEDRVLLEKSVRFGKGLQLVNVLRDLPKDLRQGRCYLPEHELNQAHIKPIDLLNPAHEARVRPVYDRYLDEAEAHLKSGWEYTCMVPYRAVRVRLACAWPVLIGLETLALLRRRQILDPSGRVKVSRGRVKRIMAGSLLLYPFAPAWRTLGRK